MSYSLVELLAKTAQVQENAELVQLVAGANSPTEAENYAKDLEYPVHLARETRLLAILKRDHRDIFDHRIVIPGNDKVDPWRYFDCTYSTRKREEKEECGVLAVRPHTPLPSLFWAYALHNVEGEKLFSFENSMPTLLNSSYTITVDSGSKSIPAGLVMNVFPGSYLARFSFVHPVTRGECTWEVHTQGWPMKSEYRRWRKESNAQACFRPILEEDKKGIEVQAAPERYVLVISDKEYRESDKNSPRRLNEKYTIEGKYFFVSPWEDMGRFIGLGGRMLPRRLYSEYVESFLSINHGVSEGGPVQARRLPVEEIVTTMIRGMPQKIKTIETLQNLFSFKLSYMPCYNENKGLASLVPNSNS